MKQIYYTYKALFFHKSQGGMIIIIHLPIISICCKKPMHTSGFASIQIAMFSCMAAQPQNSNTETTTGTMSAKRLLIFFSKSMHRHRHILCSENTNLKWDFQEFLSLKQLHNLIYLFFKQEAVLFSSYKSNKLVKEFVWFWISLAIKKMKHWFSLSSNHDAI